MNIIILIFTRIEHLIEQLNETIKRLSLGWHTQYFRENQISTSQLLHLYLKT